MNSFYVTDHWKLNRRITVDYGSRFDHYGPTYPNDPYGNAVWLPGQYQTASTNSGVSVAQPDPECLEGRCFR